MKISGSDKCARKQWHTRKFCYKALVCKYETITDFCVNGILLRFLHT